MNSLVRVARFLLRRPTQAEEPFPEPSGEDAVFITFRETPCLALYAYIVLAILVYALWLVRRKLTYWYQFGPKCVQLVCSPKPARAKKKGGLSQPLLGNRPEKPPHLPTCWQRLTDSQGRRLTFEGYVDNWLGTLVCYLIPITSFVIFWIFAVILYDYYSGCEWRWPEQLCYVGQFPLFGSFETNSYVFLMTWTSGVIWFGFLIWGRGGQTRNTFRLHARLEIAQYIHVTVQEREDTLSSGHSRFLAACQVVLTRAKNKLGLRDILGGLFGLSGLPSQTVPFKHDSHLGISFVEFRCVRYVFDYNIGSFTQYDPGEALQGGHARLLHILEAGGLCSQVQPATGKTPSKIPTVDDMFRRTGRNMIPFEVDGWGAAIADEFATFFFLYQFAIYAVCVWFSYWHYTIIAIVVAAASGIFNVAVRLGNQRYIKGMIEQTSRVKLLRNGQVIEANSQEVVPGDIVKVEGSNWPVPCDLLLLRGAAVCDESTLTGESMPVQRLSPTEELKEPGTSMRFPPKHVLVAGTVVLQTSGEDCWAVATHIGVATQRGQLLLTILFPPKLLFKYDEQLGVVFGLLIGYAIIVMFTVMRVMYVRYASQQSLPITATWASAVFTCSCVLPTMLHIVLSVGQVVAAKRLAEKDSGVFCCAPKRIALAGKVRVVCFDKTGTLTESSLHFYGVHCIQSSRQADLQLPSPFAAHANPDNSQKPVLEPEFRAHSWSLEVVCGLASAHSLSPFWGSEAGVVGNAVEVNMFRASGWQLDTQSEIRSPPIQGSGTSAHQLRIIRRFDFSHNTMTMSSIVEHLPSKQCGVYCKGSFEQIVQRCKPESVPEDFAAVAQRHASSGIYVLAIAMKSLPAGSSSAGAIMTREEAEKDLMMLGLLLFKNPLRVDTRQTIERLREGQVRSVMITGDAAGTAICIAREASLVQPGVPVLLGDIPSGEKTVSWQCQLEDLTAMNEVLLGNEWLTWRRNYKKWRTGEGRGARGEASARARRQKSTGKFLARTNSWPNTDDVEDGNTAQESTSEQFEFSTEELVLSRLFEWCELAVTQRAYEWLVNTPCTPDLRRVLLGSRRAALKKGQALSSGFGNSSLAFELLTSIRIFGRMTPSGKVSVVEGLMAQGLISAMVGDGGNDSGALRSAHVGLALSNATSATVVAPFTTNRNSVAPIVDLLREGRAALATSFAGYKYCIHYGLLNSFFKFKTYWHGIGQSMSARYLQDLFGFLGFSWAITLARPATTLVGDRPTSSLFSVFVCSSVVGMWVLNMFFIHFGMQMVMDHEDFEPFPVHLVQVTKWWKLSRNWETTTVFFLYSFQQFWSAAVFSFGHLFRQSWYRNLVLLLFLFTGFCFLIFLLLSEPNTLTRFFHLAYEPITEYEPWSPELPCPAMPWSLRLNLLLVIIGNMTACGVFENVIVLGRVGDFLRTRCRYLSKHITLRL